MSQFAIVALVCSLCPRKLQQLFCMRKKSLLHILLFFELLNFFYVHSFLFFPGLFQNCSRFLIMVKIFKLPLLGTKDIKPGLCFVSGHGPHFSGIISGHSKDVCYFQATHGYLVLYPVNTVIAS